MSGGEHSVSAKFRGLRNRFVRWWVLGYPHDQPTFTSVFETNVIFSGANRVSAAFQAFSCVSATFQLRFSSLEVFLESCFCPKISAFLKVKLLVKLLLLCVSAEGRHPGELRGNDRVGTQGTQVEGDKK